MSYTFQCRIFTALTQDTFENLDDGNAWNYTTLIWFFHWRSPCNRV